MILIAITGGIGSGKSVVSRVLKAMGYPVYDCDSRAKALMDSDQSIKRRIAVEIATEAITDVGEIDRPVLAGVVFADPAKLATLNSIVHTAVKADCIDWAKRQTSEIVFVETAILYESGFDALVDEVWTVDAPEELRVARVMERNHCSFDQVKARVDAQCFKPATPHHCCHAIDNDGEHPLLPQIENLITRLSCPSQQ